MNKKIVIVVTLAALLMASEVVFGAPKNDRKAKEKALQKTPGNTQLRCELIGLQLEEGDTVSAEEQLTLALKLGDKSCLRIHQARIALNRGKTTDAAISCAAAMGDGLLPEDEPLLYEVDSLSDGMLVTRLRRMLSKDKSSTTTPKGLGQLLLHRADTLGAIECFREAVHRGDTLLTPLLDSLVMGREDTDSLTVTSIPFTRTNGKMELNCQLNGLRIKMEVDTLAKESSISGVETLFLLKNGYVAHEDVIDNKILIIKELNFGEGLVLNGIRLHFIRNQESPVVFCLEDLRKLGRVIINEEKKTIEIGCK